MFHLHPCSPMVYFFPRAFELFVASNAWGIGTGVQDFLPDVWRGVAS
jgi:hypothetical protein